MKRATFKVLFYIKRTKALKNGTIPIYARVTINKQRAEFSIQRSIIENDWDSAKGYSKTATKINSYIDFIRSELYIHKRKAEEQGKQICAYTLKNSYLGITNDQKQILEIFKDHNEKCKTLLNIDFAQAL